MKHKSIPVFSLLMVLIATSLASFKAPFGGDHFEVYLNNRLIIQQHVAMTKTVSQFSLNEANMNDQISVKFSHCGQQGTKRHVTIRDAKNNVLKDWAYADGAEKTNMICKAKDVLALQKKTGDVQLFYSSAELPNGRLLAKINFGGESVVKK